MLATLHRNNCTPHHVHQIATHLPLQQVHTSPRATYCNTLSKQPIATLTARPDCSNSIHGAVLHMIKCNGCSIKGLTDSAPVPKVIRIARRSNHMTLAYDSNGACLAMDKSDAVAIDKRGAIIARNCPLSIARQIAERAAYASALASAADAGAHQ